MKSMPRTTESQSELNLDTVKIYILHTVGPESVFMRTDYGLT